jgi:Uma2 family endonuclease
MATQIKRTTLAEFDKFIHLPENTDKSFEFVGGEISEMVSNSFSSKIGARISGFIFMYLQQNDIGHLTGADGGYIIGNGRYIPDVTYVSYEKQPESCHEAYNPNVPDLVVEVVSPTDSERQLSIKISDYLTVGTVVWVVRPDVKEVDIFAPGQAAKSVDLTGKLDGGDILPGFVLAIKDIFPAS